MRCLFIVLTAVLLAACSRSQNPNEPAAASLPAPKSGQWNYHVKAIIPFSCQTVLLSKAANQQLSTIAQDLLGDKSPIVLQSITPADGSEAVNVAQSYQRAQAVANNLAVQGVEMSRIKLESFGGSYSMPDQPVTGCEVVLLSASR